MISLSVMLLTLAIVAVGLFFIFKMNTNPELKKAKVIHNRHLFKHHKKDKQNNSHNL